MPLTQKRKHELVPQHQLDQIKTTLLEGQQAMNNLQPNMLSLDHQSRTLTDPSWISNEGSMQRIFNEWVDLRIPRGLLDRANAHHLLAHQGNPGTRENSVEPELPEILQSNPLVVRRQQHLDLISYMSRHDLPFVIRRLGRPPWSFVPNSRGWDIKVPAEVEYSLIHFDFEGWYMIDFRTCRLMDMVTYKPRYNLRRGRTDNIYDWVKHFGHFKLDDSMEDGYVHESRLRQWSRDGLSQ